MGCEAQWAVRLCGPQAIIIADWLISKKSSPLKPSGQMNQNLVASTYGRFCIVAAKFANDSELNEHSLLRIFHRYFLPSFCSFGHAVSEIKIF
jgi:hypothetical protein